MPKKSYIQNLQLIFNQFLMIFFPDTHIGFLVHFVKGKYCSLLDKCDCKYFYGSDK